MQEQKFTFFKLINILFLFIQSWLIFFIELVKIDFDRFVVVRFMFGSTKWADKRMLMTLSIETDKVDLFPLMTLFLTLDVLDDIARYLLFHMTKIYI